MKPYVAKIVFWVKSGIRIKLLLIFIINAMIPIMLISWLGTYSTHRILMNKELDFVRDKLDTVNMSLSVLLTEIERNMTSMLTNNTLRDILINPAPSATAAWYYQVKWTDDMLRSSAYIHESVSYAILSTDGQVYGGRPGINQLETMEGKLAAVITESGWNTTIMHRNLNDYFGSLVITIGKTVKVNNRLIGIIFADIDRRWIDDMFSVLDDSANIYITRSDGSMVYTLENGVPYSNLPIDYVTSFVSGNIIQHEGEKYLCVRSHSNGLDLLAITLIPLEAVYQDSNLNLIRTGVVLIVILVQTLLFAQFFASSVSKRILSLNEQVTDFAMKKASQVIRLPAGSPDEIGQLTDGVCSMSERILEMMEVMKQNERKARKLEIAALQSQINPHMIYNTLNTITYLAQIQGTSNIEEVSSAFSRMLRLLSKTEGDYFTIRQEIEYIQSYLAIKKYQLLCNVEVFFEVDENVLDHPILKLLLQPFVENAIIHGLATQITDAHLNISIFRSEQNIISKIRDNGKGMDKSLLFSAQGVTIISDETANSVGIKNTVERLKLQYDGAGSFSIDSTLGKGTLVEISYPVMEVTSC